jgi:hypothetical protein
MASLGTRAGKAVEIIPFIPFLLGGMGDNGNGGMIQDLLDLDAWIMALGLGPGVRLEGARRAFWEVVRERGSDVSTCLGDRTLFIPTSCRNPRKRAFRSPDTEPPLPTGVRPMGTEEERTIVTALISDLNEFYGVGLDPFPLLERGVSTQVTAITKGRIVLVGASHMVRLAKCLGQGVITLAYPGFNIT